MKIDANYILQPFNDLPADGKGKCGWTDISNAIDESYRRIRSVSIEVTKLDLSTLEKLSEKAKEFDIPYNLGPWPDIQNVMITVSDLRKLRKLLQDFRALSVAPTTEEEKCPTKKS